MKNIKLIIILTSLVFANLPLTTSASVVDENQLKLVGEGKMSFLFWDVYLLRLYTANGEYKTRQHPLALEFNYLMDIEAKDLVEETVNQWREQDMSEHKDEQDWVEQLNNLWPDIQDGDQLLFIVDENKHSQFYYNQNYRGVIQSSEFSERFSAIWLSEKTTAPKVRKKLLGD